MKRCLARHTNNPPVGRGQLLMGILGSGFCAMAPANVLAHDGQPPAPHDLWQAWSWEPGILLGLALGAMVYGRGASALWRRAGVGRGVRRGQAAAFGVGLLTLFVALISPVDALGAALFAAHMVQHLLLMLIAAPLLVLGAAPIPLMWAMPRSWRGKLGRWWRRAHVFHAAWRILRRSVVAWTLHAITIWLWHLPGAYEAALHSDLLHALEHATMLVTAMLFWWAVLHPGGTKRLGYGTGVLSVFMMATQSTVLGALMTLARRPWYPSHATDVALWGLTPLEDQQLAGLIMWVPGNVVYLLAAAVLFVAWLGAVEQKVRRSEERRAVQQGDVAAAKSYKA